MFFLSFLQLIKCWDCPRFQEHTNGFSSNELEFQLPAFFLKTEEKCLQQQNQIHSRLNLLYAQNDWVCLVKVTQQWEEEKELDIPPVNRESRGFSCLTVLLSNCGAWLQDFIVTGHRGKRDFREQFNAFQI